MMHFRKLESEVMAVVEVENLGQLRTDCAHYMPDATLSCHILASLHQSHGKLCLNPMWGERE